MSYPVLLEGKEVSSQYQVSGYPTIYLLDKDGKILFVQVGYGEGVKEMLEEIKINNNFNIFNTDQHRFSIRSV